MFKGAHTWTLSEPETIQSTLTPCEIVSSPHSHPVKLFPFKV